MQALSRGWIPLLHALQTLQGTYFDQLLGRERHTCVRIGLADTDFYACQNDHTPWASDAFIALCLPLAWTSHHAHPAPISFAPLKPEEPISTRLSHSASFVINHKRSPLKCPRQSSGSSPPLLLMMPASFEYPSHASKDSDLTNTLDSKDHVRLFILMVFLL